MRRRIRSHNGWRDADLHHEAIQARALRRRQVHAATATRQPVREEFLDERVLLQLLADIHGVAAPLAAGAGAGDLALEFVEFRRRGDAVALLGNGLRLHWLARCVPDAIIGRLGDRRAALGLGVLLGLLRVAAEPEVALLKVDLEVGVLPTTHLVPPLAGSVDGRDARLGVLNILICCGIIAVNGDFSCVLQEPQRIRLLKRVGVGVRNNVGARDLHEAVLGGRRIGACARQIHLHVARVEDELAAHRLGRAQAGGVLGDDDLARHCPLDVAGDLAQARLLVGLQEVGRDVDLGHNRAKGPVAAHPTEERLEKAVALGADRRLKDEGDVLLRHHLAHAAHAPQTDDRELRRRVLEIVNLTDNRPWRLGGILAERHTHLGAVGRQVVHVSCADERVGAHARVAAEQGLERLCVLLLERVRGHDHARPRVVGDATVVRARIVEDDVAGNGRGVVHMHRVAILREGRRADAQEVRVLRRPRGVRSGRAVDQQTRAADELVGAVGRRLGVVRLIPDEERVVAKRRECARQVRGLVDADLALPRLGIRTKRGRHLSRVAKGGRDIVDVLVLHGALAAHELLVKFVLVVAADDHDAPDRACAQHVVCHVQEGLGLAALHLGGQEHLTVAGREGG